MTYVADQDTRDRKIRAARMAAASAVGNGVDPDEVRAAVEQGIREALDLEERKTSPTTATGSAATAPRWSDWAA